MQVHIIPVLKDNYAYIVQFTDGTNIVVDPGQAAPVQAFLKKNKIQPHYILLTHHHGDHIAGAHDIKFEYNAVIIGPAKELSKIPDVNQPVTHGDQTQLGKNKLEIIETPGHTLGHIVFYMPEHALLFSGDTLFTMGCGRVFEGTMREMYESLLTLKHLPDETKIYSGHNYLKSNIDFIRSLDWQPEGLEEYITRLLADTEKGNPCVPTQLSDEKKFNPFLAAENLDRFKLFRTKKDNF